MPPPRTFDSDHPPPDAGASESNALHGSNESNASKVLACGLTLDSFDACDSDQGPKLMQLMHLKVLALGPTLGSLDAFYSDQGSEANASNASKVLALGLALDSLKAHSIPFASEAPAGASGACI